MTENTNKKLFQAVRYGTPPNIALKRVTQLLEEGTDPNLVYYDKYIYGDENKGWLFYLHCSLLTVAIMQGHIHIVKKLIENGARHTNTIESLKCKKPVDIAAILWYKMYVSNELNPTNRTPVSCNISKYQIIWPGDVELKAYRILKYLLDMGGKVTVDDVLLGKTIKNKFLEREIRQRKVDQLFEEAINVNTNTNIGTMIVRCEKHAFGLNYLSYTDVIF